MAGHIVTTAWDGSVAELVCPRCHGALVVADDALTCTPCTARYPVVLGIPDLRVGPDPWIGLDADRMKAMALDELTRDMDFEDTVRAYWSMTPDTPADAARRFIRHVLDAETRSRQWLASLDAGGVSKADGPWLDVGCGTADLAAAAGRPVVGCDVALRWLVVARKRLAAAGRTPHLVCCNAERLPFRRSTFARVLALGLIEHVDSWPPVARELRRVLAAGGDLHARTANRFSLLPEPHVGVWGVGFIPRQWADRFVQWRAGQRYQHHRCRSPRELRLGLTEAGFARVEVRPAPVLESDRARLGGLLARAVGFYERGRRLPGIRVPLTWVAPVLDVYGAAP